MPEPGTQGFKCVQNKIAAYKKRTGRQPNQSIVGKFQADCYRSNSLKIRQGEEMEKLRDKPRY
tara:strand:- start:164 stop:352 length:189 start_codon:yes stop_codon:yes gene_type:complete